MSSFQADGASSNTKACGLLTKMKRAAVKAAVAEERAAWVETGIEGLDAGAMSKMFFVLPGDPKSWRPVEIFRFMDPVHMGKNGEKAGMAVFGKEVRLGTGAVVRNLVACAAFAFARLTAITLEVRDLVRAHVKGVGKKLATVPGVVTHRLKIIPTLCDILVEHAPALRDVFAMMKPLLRERRRAKFLKHVTGVCCGAAQCALVQPLDAARSALAPPEVDTDLADPRVLSLAAFMRGLLEWQQLWYAVWQVHLRSTLASGVLPAAADAPCAPATHRSWTAASTCASPARWRTRCWPSCRIAMTDLTMFTPI